MVLKYFLAEGVVCRHELFVSAAQESPDDILQVGPTDTNALVARCCVHAAFFRGRRGQGASGRSRVACVQHCPHGSGSWALLREPLPQKLTVSHHMGGGSLPLIDSGRGHSLTLSLHIKGLLGEGRFPLGIYNII